MPFVSSAGDMTVDAVFLVVKFARFHAGQVTPVHARIARDAMVCGQETMSLARTDLAATLSCADFMPLILHPGQDFLLGRLRRLGVGCDGHCAETENSHGENESGAFDIHDGFLLGRLRVGEPAPSIPRLNLSP
jgi:hypothetical protein